MEEIDISKIHPNKNQPRKYFDERKLCELSENMKKYGQLQPITVRPDGDGYEIVLGERRYRAAKLGAEKQTSQFANFSQLKCIVKELSDEEAFDLSASENLQREDLNPIEEARVYKHYKDKGMKLEEIAEKVNKSVGRISQIMSILKASGWIQTLLAKTKLSMEQGISIRNLQKRCDKLMDKYEKRISRVGYAWQPLLAKCFNSEFSITIDEAIEKMKADKDDRHNIGWFGLVTVDVRHLPDHLASRIAFHGLKAPVAEINQLNEDLRERVIQDYFYEPGTWKLSDEIEVEDFTGDKDKDFHWMMSKQMKRQTNDVGRCLWYDDEEDYHTNKVGMEVYHPALKTKIWFCTICAEKHREEIERIFSYLTFTPLYSPFSCSYHA